MNPPLPSLTTVWHNDTYSVISSFRPEISAAGKTVIIAGAISYFSRFSWGLFPPTHNNHQVIMYLSHQ